MRRLLFALWLPLAAQMPQNPSPMKDSPRAHQRVPRTQPPGERYPLSLGSLFLAGPRRGAIPIVVHFHGDPWLAETSALRRSRHVAVLSVNLGAGSGVYRQALGDPGRFSQLLAEAAMQLPAGSRFQPVIVTSFSAGYGAVREIRRNPANRAQIDAVVLMDGLHSSYVPESQPGPIDTESLRPFVDFFARSRRGAQTDADHPFGDFSRDVRQHHGNCRRADFCSWTRSPSAAALGTARNATTKPGKCGKSPDSGLRRQ
jgi:hypothetical protein